MSLAIVPANHGGALIPPDDGTWINPATPDDARGTYYYDTRSGTMFPSPPAPKKLLDQHRLKMRASTKRRCQQYAPFDERKRRRTTEEKVESELSGLMEETASPPKACDGDDGEARQSNKNFAFTSSCWRGLDKNGWATSHNKIDSTLLSNDESSDEGSSRGDMEIESDAGDPGNSLGRAGFYAYPPMPPLLTYVPRDPVDAKFEELIKQSRILATLKTIQQLNEKEKDKGVGGQATENEHDAAEMDCAEMDVSM